MTSYAKPADAANTPRATDETAEQALLRAQAAAQAKRYGEAAGICSDVLAIKPQLPSALALLGIVNAQRGDITGGIRLLEKAITQQGSVAAWHANLSSLQRMINNVHAAVGSGQEAVRLAPDSVENLVTLSLALTDVDDGERAVACLLRAIGLNDQHADAHLALAQHLLARGEFDPGWIEYEWRNQTEAGRGQLPRITSAPWTGMAIPGGKILLIGDQGYGDTIQFSRYIPLVAARCGDVFLGCSAEIAPLLERSWPGVRVFHKWNEIPGHAAYSRLSSLAMLFRTTLESIPGLKPYLRTEPEMVARWRARLDQTISARRMRVGLAWSGRPTHPNDRRRTISLERLRPLAAQEGVTFVCLQKPIPEADRPLLSDFPGLIDISGELSDFDQTAAVIAGLDLVICVDTAVGHLAGALGKPTWIMLPKASDWRWLLDRADSPWYPSVRLFRQPVSGAWNAVIEEVRTALAELCRSYAPAGLAGA